MSTPLDDPEVARGARDIDSCTERLVTPCGRAAALTTYAATPILPGPQFSIRNTAGTSQLYGRSMRVA